MMDENELGVTCIRAGNHGDEISLQFSGIQRLLVSRTRLLTVKKNLFEELSEIPFTVIRHVPSWHPCLSLRTYAGSIRDRFSFQTRKY